MSFPGGRGRGRPGLRFRGAFSGLPPVRPVQDNPVPRDLQPRTYITIDGEKFEIEADDLESICELGRGAYGVVEKMKHKKTGNIIAVKRITHTFDSLETKRSLMDMDIAMRSADCPYTVHFFGAMFRDGDIMICMEVMDISLDKFYMRAFASHKRAPQNQLAIPESILGKIAYSVVKALEYLKEHLNVIHRDVKPSNILINRSGEVKMCDFGVSGYLVNSVAKTTTAGCKPYFAPERVDPRPSSDGSFKYDIRSDVWSLGIAMVEISTGCYPYRSGRTPFEQLSQVLDEPAPALPEGLFSHTYMDFINKALQKDVESRANLQGLLDHPFLEHHASANVDVAQFVAFILDNSSQDDEVVPRRILPGGAVGGIPPGFARNGIM